MLTENGESERSRESFRSCRAQVSRSHRQAIFLAAVVLFLEVVIPGYNAGFNHLSLNSRTTNQSGWEDYDDLNLEKQNHSSVHFHHPRPNISSLSTQLELVSTRYYIYTDENITQNRSYKISPPYWARYGQEALYEQLIMRELHSHPLRTNEPEKADIFIIPTPITTSLVSSGLSTQEAFTALEKHPIFKEHGGRKHLAIAVALPILDYGNRGNVKALNRWFRKLENVTFCAGYDSIASEIASQSGTFDGTDYEGTFRDGSRALVHHLFSIGLGDADQGFPLLPASMKKFKSATYHIFYRTRVEPSFNNSTRFRHAPVYNVSHEHLPESSIGFDLPTKREWVSHYLDSQFCLVVRGDNPQSHAWIRSVKAGCIPVVISDLYPIYAPALKSSIDMHDFSIFIKEDQFIKNPTGELQKLHNLSDSIIQSKIEALAFAQRVLFPDHKDSLFVPAFLREAQKAMKYSARVTPLRWQY